MHKGHHHAYTSRDDMIAAGKYRKVGLELCFFAGEIMRTVIFLVCMLLPGATFADSVRHLSVPERFWGIWAPSTDLCRDDKSIFVVSAKGYVTAQANCTIQWLTETAGADGPIYSAHMRCSNPAAPESLAEKEVSDFSRM